MIINYSVFNTLVWGWIVLALITFVLLMFIRAPYGRHQRPGWGIAIPARLGWITMELPSLIIIPMFWSFAEQSVNHSTLTVNILSALWFIHYFHRTLIWPVRAKISNTTMPISIVIFAFIFNCMNGLINAYSIFYASYYSANWHYSKPFLLGSAIFVMGFLVNLISDNELFKIRKNLGKGYGIPNGGFYRWVTCPNYLGEILEWIGWAIACWSLAGCSFAIWVIANLVPRARSNHQWYHEQFKDYPKKRKILVPYIW